MNKIILLFKSILSPFFYPRISFKDGTSMSFFRASRLLRKEGKLRSGPCVILNGVPIRDAVGVIENHQPKWVLDGGSKKQVVLCNSQRDMANSWFKWCIHAECDTQPREVGYQNNVDAYRIRSKHMSRYIRDYIKNRGF